eukprot:9499115-Pyramimonas_sp.AAC.3
MPQHLGVGVRQAEGGDSAPGLAPIGGGALEDGTLLGAEELQQLPVRPPRNGACRAALCLSVPLSASQCLSVPL